MRKFNSVFDSVFDSAFDSVSTSVSTAVVVSVVVSVVSCGNSKDHPAECGSILECSDGSFDYDGDGYCANDCNDDSCDINPGAPEVCDDVDNDCDGLIDGLDGDIRSDDEYDVVEFYVDKDMDGSPSDDKEGACVYRKEDAEYYSCYDKESDLGCERGTEPVCQYPVNLGDNVFECGPDDECTSADDVGYRAPF